MKINNHSGHLKLFAHARFGCMAAGSSPDPPVTSCGVGIESSVVEIAIYSVLIEREEVLIMIPPNSVNCPPWENHGNNKHNTANTLH